MLFATTTPPILGRTSLTGRQQALSLRPNAYQEITISKRHTGHRRAYVHIRSVKQVKYATI